MTHRAGGPPAPKRSVSNLTTIVYMIACLSTLVPVGSGTNTGVLNAAFVCVDGVYNSELTAPYDVLQHTVFRDERNYIRCFIVTPDGEPFETFEGITITPHYSFDDAPDVDILVIPSTETSMSDDLHDERLIDWIDRAANKADWVITVCDGAFPLAATGQLNDRSATTFPSDRAALAERFNKIDVRDDVRLVVDGKFITSVGGGMSYEPAFYLVERLYGKDHARKTARGLVWPWSLESVPCLERP
jgi:transcriptional regulator GlxA family with amidase domain